MILDNLIYKIVSRFFPRLVTSDMLVRDLKRRGVNIGKGTFIFDAGSTRIDGSRPELLKIGEYCKITGGVTILTHDYSRSVLRMVYGDVVGEAQQTIIGNNCFIGMNSIILMGSQIGNNCIVGAGSVVCGGGYPENTVIAGNPAKVIMSLQTYYEKRKKSSIEEAREYIKLFYQNYGKVPTIKEMGAFFPLYLERTEEALKNNQIRTALSGDDEKDVISCFLHSKSKYASYKEFIKECKLEL